MTDLPVAEAIDPRLRAYFADELRRAESDFQHVRRPTAERADRRLAVGTLLAIAALAGLIAVLPRLVGTRSPAGEPVIATDGLPIAIDGEAVLRLGDVVARLGDNSTFFAGGTLMLRSSSCPTLAGETPSPCVEDWNLSGDPAQPAVMFALESVTSASGFVRTSGAATVVRVSSSRSASNSQGECSGECEGVLTVQAVVWRQPTKGPIPPNAAPPEGGLMDEALVPDFVSALARDGVTIAGYIPKRYILYPTLGPGSPSNPPQSPPQPVYGEDLTTVVGHMVPDVGFVPLESR